MKKTGKMIRAKRKNRYPAFDGGRNLPQALLLVGFFGMGLWLSRLAGGWGIASYLLLWMVSYPVIYAGTCRYCAYYGQKCPVPLEGACVHRFFPPGGKPFGSPQLLWALAAYFLRVIVPVIVIVSRGAYLSGLAYALLFAAFWIVHLRIAGCPNCINEDCPLNPGRSSS